MPINRKELFEKLVNSSASAEDTEDMFWLRRSDDYQSKVALGNALSASYRFEEAVAAYSEAEAVRSDDPMLYIRIGGAHLTLRHFDKARAAYERALELGIPEKTAAFYIGIWYYLQKDFAGAAKWLEKCLPCGDEMKIAAIYWHTLACLKAGTDPVLLSEYYSGMAVGHHTAYKTAVEVIAGKTALPGAIEAVEKTVGDFDYVTVAYGVGVYLASIGEDSAGEELFDKALLRERYWPSVPYLAALSEGMTGNEA